MPVALILALVQALPLIVEANAKLIEAIKGTNAAPTPEHLAQLAANASAHNSVIGAITGIIQAHAGAAA